MALGILAVGYLLTRGLELHAWDEFTHWGMLVHFIKLNQAIPFDVNHIAFPSYLTGMSLWIDFLTFPGQLKVQDWYFANYAIIVFSLWLGVVSLKGNMLNQSRQVIAAWIILFFIFLVLIYQSGNGLFSLYVDINLAIFFFVGLVACSFVHDNKESIFILTTQCILLLITKHIGFVLALLLVACWIIQKISKEKMKETIFFSMVPLAVSIFLKKAWDLRLMHLNLRKNFSEDGIQLAAFFKRLATFSLKAFESEVLNHFIVSVLRNKIFILNIVLVTALATVYCKKQNPKNLSRIVSAFFLSSVGYLGILCLSYIFLFGEYEAKILASFNRYIFPVLAGWILVFLLYIFKNLSFKYFDWHSNKVYFKKYSLFIVGIFVFLIKERNLAQDHHPKLDEISQIASKVKISLKKPSKIFLLWQNSNGFEYWMFRYNVYPCVLQNDAIWSVGEPYDQGDLWTQNLSLQQLMHKIEKFEYLMVVNGNDKFWDKYGKAFDAHKDGLYKILMSDQNSVKLSWVKSL